MAEQFEIIEVPPDAPHTHKELGSKDGFWYYQDKSTRWMFKEARGNTGEDWAEKVAAELCQLLALPHAGYELASWRGKRGVVTPSFVPDDGTLMFGNEILSAALSGYPKPAGVDNRSRCRVPQHTVSLVLDVHENLEQLGLPLDWNALSGISRAAEVFVGYLMLDAWIANTDRHHTNWGWIFLLKHEGSERVTVSLAPTFDHASSLGCHITEEECEKRLTTKDRGQTVEAYVEKGRSALYHEEDTKPFLIVKAFREAAIRIPGAAKVWLKKLESLSETDVEHIFEQVPLGRMSTIRRKFAQRVLAINKRRLLDLLENIS